MPKSVPAGRAGRHLLHPRRLRLRQDCHFAGGGSLPLSFWWGKGMEKGVGTGSVCGWEGSVGGERAAWASSTGSAHQGWWHGGQWDAWEAGAAGGVAYAFYRLLCYFLMPLPPAWAGLACRPSPPVACTTPCLPLTPLLFANPRRCPSTPTLTASSTSAAASAATRWRRCVCVTGAVVVRLWLCCSVSGKWASLRACCCVSVGVGLQV